MIHIERHPATPPLPVFNQASVGRKGAKVTRADDERGKAIAFFTDPVNYLNEQKLSKATFIFKVYKDSALATALEKIFGCKCAYCESRFAHVTPKDIEHFRPKSEIENQNQPTLRPAYFWLAGEWTNLLISCADCNRARNHEVPGQPKKVRLGKQAQFPMADERHRVRLHTQDVAVEEPHRLLLNPCADRPEEHLTYDDQAFVYPKTLSDEKAKTSIFVYALQRQRLVDERKRVLNDLVLKFELLRALAVEYNAMAVEDAVARRAAKLEQIQMQMRSICMMFTADAPFLGMVRDHLRRHLAAGEFADVQSAGVDLPRLIA